MKKLILSFIVGLVLGASASHLYASTVSFDPSTVITALKGVVTVLNGQIAYLTALSTATPPIVTPPLTVKLVTNEYAHWNPTDLKSILSPTWDMTSGSLFQYSDGRYWSGVPDTVSPNPTSSNGTDSAIFRLNTSNFSYKNFTVSFDYVKNGIVPLTIDPATKKEIAWAGAHIFLDYQSEYGLYYASFDRVDGVNVIKKKCSTYPYASANNYGIYYELNPEVSHPIPTGIVQHISASSVNNSDGSVTLKLYNNGTLVTQATDKGTGCAVYTSGAVGLRGDDDNFTFSGFKITSL